MVHLPNRRSASGARADTSGHEEPGARVENRRSIVAQWTKILFMTPSIPCRNTNPITGCSTSDLAGEGSPPQHFSNALKVVTQHN